MRIFDFSGHSTRDAILNYILKVAPKKAFLVHGDDGAVEWFRQEITRRLPNTEVIIPQPGIEYEIKLAHGGPPKVADFTINNPDFPQRVLSSMPWCKTTGSGERVGDDLLLAMKLTARPSMG